MEQNTKKQERQLEVIFLLAVFLTILMWALVQPFNVSPDEAMRYQIVDYIMRHGKLPVGYDAEIRDPNWGISYAFYPITTYIAGAVFGKIATLFSSSGMAPIYGARLVNVIFGTITAGLNLKIGKMLFEKRMAFCLVRFSSTPTSTWMRWDCVLLRGSSSAGARRSKTTGA